MENVWIAGRVTAVTEKGQVWELQGIFAEEKDAVAACRDWTYFVTSIPWNASLPHETMEDNGYWPIPRTAADITDDIPA